MKDFRSLLTKKAEETVWSFSCFLILSVSSYVILTSFCGKLLINAGSKDSRSLRSDFIRMTVFCSSFEWDDSLVLMVAWILGIKSPPTTSRVRTKVVIKKTLSLKYLVSSCVKIVRNCFILGPFITFRLFNFSDFLFVACVFDKDVVQGWLHNTDTVDIVFLD